MTHDMYVMTRSASGFMLGILEMGKYPVHPSVLPSFFWVAKGHAIFFRYPGDR